MTNGSAVPDAWFGDYLLQPGVTAFWQIGPMRFWLTHGDQEWRFASLPGDDTLDPTLERDLTGGVPEPPEAEKGASRLGFRRTPDLVSLTPLTADRPMVVKPITPFLLPPGEELTLYISTILWLQVTVGEDRREFLQIPLFRPSDTWFGSSTRDGEMCYALQTSARLRLENLPRRPHRAISALVVRNRAAQNLAIEKVLLPLPHMSLFAAEDGQLWTEEVTLEHTDGRHEAPLDLSDGPPAQAGVTRRIGGPRQRAPRGLLTRAFSGLMGGGY
ncbi:hypothetical protein KJ682_07450 [bacterium]|nr:hypothetical protein [bacterium]